VVTIEGQSPYNYIDRVATTQSGNYLDHGIRVNSVLTSYRVGANNRYSQKLGDLAGVTDVRRSTLTFTLIPANSTKVETVKIPYLANYLGLPFTDQASL
jgi:hypothetical protein